MRRISISGKCLAFVLLLTMCIGWNVSISNSISTVAQAETGTTQATGINVAYHTVDEVREYIKANGATPKDKVEYKEEPSIVAPYKAGSLTDETLNSALNMVNQIRYIAGLSHNLTLDKKAVELTQAASLVNKVNDQLSHYPTKPSDMEDSLYEIGALGARSSNIAVGYSSINYCIVYGYMEDGDSSNIGRVGHRRWILNPKMAATGFGYCEGYNALYVFNQENKTASEYGVAWPAQTMPTDYFGVEYPWSISMGYTVDKGSVQVKLVRLSDNRTWNFSSASSDGYFNVDNGGYGQTGCIIFRPDDIEGYKDGDQFQVTISGLGTPVSYCVTFFDLVPVSSVSIEKNDTKIVKGDSIYLIVNITPSNASNQDIVWYSSNDAVAEVIDYGSHGLVKGKGYGKAILTATSGNGLTATYELTVVPDSVEIRQLTSKKKGQITVTYDKDKSVSGYEILVATNEKFTKNKKTATVKKAGTTKATISGLKAGQLYYVKVRPYVMVNGKKAYGEYSIPASVRVAK